MSISTKHKKTYIIVTVVFIAIVAMLLWRFSLSRPNLQDGEVITQSTDEPSRKKPEEEGYVWRGGPTDPKQIVIDSIGVKSYIQKVGIDQNKRVGVPSNIYLTGWFVESVLPGEQGLSIIDGHVVDQSDQGIFTRLAELEQGERYRVTFGDDSSREFEVVETQTIDVAKAESVLFSQDPTITHQLNLITCGGSYDAVSRSFDKRVIVISKLVQ